MKAESEIYKDILLEIFKVYPESFSEEEKMMLESDDEYTYSLANDNIYFSEYMQEYRESFDEETDIDHDWSRHYEAKSVAKQLNNGKWVGYTYWFGGGKHGEPEAIDWIPDSYFLNCEVKVVEKNFFTKA